MFGVAMTRLQPSGVGRRERPLSVMNLTGAMPTMGSSGTSPKTNGSLDPEHLNEVSRRLSKAALYVLGEKSQVRVSTIEIGLRAVAQE